LPKLTVTLLKDYFFFKSFRANLAKFGVNPLAIVLHLKLFERNYSATLFEKRGVRGDFIR